jgi:hypothetical protein
MEALVNRLLTLCVKIKEKRGKRISGGEPVPDQNDKADQNDKTGQNDKTDQNDKAGQTGKQAASRVG